MLGVIGGTSFLKSRVFNCFQKTTIDTPYGGVLVYRKGRIIFVQRHATDPVKPYVPPHKINFRAIIWALKELECDRVVGFCSVGSLKREITVGTVLIPDDYFNLFNPLTLFDDGRGHIVPSVSKELRTKICDALIGADFTFRQGGTYVQAIGPRFETPAEVRFSALMGDVIGMTGASECELCNELSIDYAMVTMVDNYANGIEPLTVEGFKEGVAYHLKHIERVLETVLAAVSSVPLVFDEPGEGKVMETVDLVVNARYVLPMEDRTVLKHHAVVVNKSRIVDIIPQEEVFTKYNCRTIVDRPQHVLIPGLINAHTHAGMSLLRGYADDANLASWLNDFIWPAEAEFVSTEFVYDGTELAIAEMIRSGTTTFNDMYWHPASAGAAVEVSGIRAQLSAVAIDFPSEYAKDFDEYIANGLAAREKLKDNPRISFSIGPHAPYTVNDKHWEKVKEVAEKYNLKIHTHLHETSAEVNESKKGNRSSLSCHQSDMKCAPIANLDRMGLINDRLVAAHMVVADDEEIELLAKRGVSTVHCPTSNMKLVCGFSPVVKLMRAGINVALGTDSAGSNNSLDLMAEIKQAALLGKMIANDADAMHSFEAMQMATINGAKALGLEKDIGSLTKGKAADMVAVSLSEIETQPLYSVMSHLVYVAGRERVTDVWVDGRQLMKNRVLITLNQESIVRKAHMWRRRISKFRDSRLSKEAAAREGKEHKA